jgi:hypothetical protein
LEGSVDAVSGALFSSFAGALFDALEWAFAASTKSSEVAVRRVLRVPRVEAGLISVARLLREEDMRFVAACALRPLCTVALVSLRPVLFRLEDAFSDAAAAADVLRTT